jgi:hypothetical protein
MKVRALLSLVIIVAGLLAFAPSPRPARAQQHDIDRAAPPTGGPYYALVIGDDDYDSLPKLATAAKDARAVERMLREYYGFQTTLLVNATRSQVVSALSDYRHKLGADASLLVYYTGHGHRDGKADRAFWLPVDASREDASSWINVDEVTNAIRAVPARHVLVVSDSCYAGAVPSALDALPTRPEERERILQKMAAGRSRTLLASGGDEPFADESGDGSLSVFAAALLRGLRATDGPRFSASELFVGYVLGPVAGRTGRIPVYNPLRNSGHEGGDFVFTRVKPFDAVCDDLEEKEKHYRTFLDNYKGGPEQQKDAYEAGKDYVARYDRCPEARDKEIVGYIRNWLAKYEDAVRKFQEYQRRRP